MMERRDVQLLETKASDVPGSFSGYGAVFGNVDAQGDVIREGAFTASLTEWEGRGKLPPMLLQHGGGPFGGNANDLLPVGQWTAMREDPRGLKVDGRLFALETERGRYLYEGLKAGVLDGLSIGFQTREFVEGRGRGAPDRILTAVDLWEVSIVTFPANPQARIASVKTLTLDSLRELEDALYDDLQDRRFSRSDAKAVIASIRKYLGRDGRDAGEYRDGAPAGEWSWSDVRDALHAIRDEHLAHALKTTLTQSAGGRRS